eukprot:TRINITY_DN322_c0_g1_i1.p1 TRINITY_DN322_c0_g1~~TRINITY_DN322_c0_g1_i1.p1  ORF type:complete len:248 (+),score=33.29 TRINITY_DN322_c0_g1_i1:288-1031(+)
MTYQEFVKSTENRQRYWARSMMAWPYMSTRPPTTSHHEIEKLRGLKVKHIITQNVDGLHWKASPDYPHNNEPSWLTELHGTLREVVCLDCKAKFDRDSVQELMVIDNPQWVIPQHLYTAAYFENLRADGDIEWQKIPPYTEFKLPTCFYCNSSNLKPDVVFFGESVDKTIVQRCFKNVEESDGLLVVGSSLTVFSSYRFIKHATALNIPIAIINVGETRADSDPVLKIEQPVGKVLQSVVKKLTKTE